ncbi:MAG: signal peptidase I [Thermoleophilia bacterium]
MKRFANSVTTFLSIAILAVVVLAIVMPMLLGLQRYVITGGSMTGSIPKGAVVYAKLVPVQELKVGDVITFTPPSGGAAVTHRITAIQTAAEGQLVFQTKGDANAAADPWKMTLKEPAQARYSFHVPYLGYVFGALAVREYRMILIGVPAVIIAFSMLWTIWRRPEERDDAFDCEDERADDEVHVPQPLMYSGSYQKG